MVIMSKICTKVGLLLPARPQTDLSADRMNRVHLSFEAGYVL